MIKTTNGIIVVQGKITQTEPRVIYSRILETKTDWLSETFEVVFEDFYIIDNYDEIIRSDTFKISFEKYDTLLAQIGSITSKETEKEVLAQAHLYINNRDNVYGTQWIAND